MITVVCLQTGDTAEAPSPDGALLAARTLMEDAHADSNWGFKPTCTFYVDGEPVVGLSNVGQPAVWAALGALRRKDATCPA